MSRPPRRRLLAAHWSVCWTALIVVASNHTSRAADSLLIQTEAALTTAIQSAEDAIVAITRLRAGNQIVRFDELVLPPGERRDRFAASSPDHPDFVPTEFGSGIVVRSPDAGPLIITNYHVVKGGPVAEGGAAGEARIHVQSARRRGGFAEIIAADPRSDLAVLRLRDRESLVSLGELRPLSLQEAEPARKGRWIILLGNPHATGRDGSPSASLGILSNVARRPVPPARWERPEQELNPTIHHFGALWQVDARLNLGSSGAAALDLSGKLVGIGTSLAAIEGYEQSAGFIIPFDKPTLRIVRHLLRGEEPDYGFLGVTPDDLTPSEARSRGVPLDVAPAARVVQVIPGGAAAMAGLQTGDIIRSVNNQPIRSRNDLMREVGLQAPETMVELRVIRQGEAEQTVRVKVGKWPVADDEGLIATKPKHPVWRGLGVDFSTARHRFLLLTGAGIPQGVLIVKVAAESPAARAQLQAGQLIVQVNQKTVRSPTEFQQAVADVAGPVKLLLHDGQTITIPE